MGRAIDPPFFTSHHLAPLTLMEPTLAEKPVVVRPGRRVPVWWWFAAFLALGIAAYSLRYALLGEPAYTPELAPSFRERQFTVTVHTLFGPIALLFGLVNLLPAMRQRRRWVAHRWRRSASWARRLVVPANASLSSIKGSPEVAAESGPTDHPRLIVAERATPKERGT